MVREQFNQEITRQLVEQYDPTRVAGRRLTKGLREHFYKAREAFRRDIDAIPISSMAFRPVQLEKFQRCLARRSKMTSPPTPGADRLRFPIRAST